MLNNGPLLIAYDGSDAARHAAARQRLASLVHHAHRTVLVVPSPARATARQDATAGVPGILRARAAITR